MTGVGFRVADDFSGVLQTMLLGMNITRNDWDILVKEEKYERAAEVQ